MASLRGREYGQPVTKQTIGGGTEAGLDPVRGAKVAGQLRKLGVKGILITAAERGYIVDLTCAMPKCLCPDALGGRAYFEEKTPSLPDWMPTADHFPKLKEEGGQRTLDNIRLAHRLCNRIDYSRRIGRPHEKDLRRVEEARARAEGRL